jgi:hypothetical protein
MGKALIIKGADFSENALGVIEEMYEDITDELIQGVVATSVGNVKLFNASYNSTSTLIPKYLILMASTTAFYDTRGKGVEWFVPAGFQVLPFVHKESSTIASDGIISDSAISNPATYIIGDGTWVKASDIYANVGVSESTYPCYNVSICRYGETPLPALSLADAKALGFKVRKLKNV